MQQVTGGFDRALPLLGQQGLQRLQNATVCVIGLGGVGGGAVEGLARAGVGCIRLVDGDTVQPSNLNRQLIALQSTLGMPKPQAAALRIQAMGLGCQCQEYSVFYTPQQAEALLSGVDFVLDCVDDMAAKVDLAVRCTQAGIPLIASMGTGNKLHPELLTICDLSKTTHCPLARSFRHKLRQQGITHLPVVSSTEQPIPRQQAAGQAAPPASLSFVPPVAGLMMAGYAVRRLAGLEP